MSATVLLHNAAKIKIRRTRYPSFTQFQLVVESHSPTEPSSIITISGQGLGIQFEQSKVVGDDGVERDDKVNSPPLHEL